jgi:hypothetical protein
MRTLRCCLYLLIVSFAAFLAASATTVESCSKNLAAKNWANWFVDSVFIIKKKEYTYVLWDISKSEYTSADQLAEETIKYVSAKLCKDVVNQEQASNLVKVDLVKVKEQDQYGKPRWDTVERIAHSEVECLKLREVFSQSPAAACEAIGKISVSKY